MTDLSLCSLGFGFLGLPHLCLFLNHSQESVASPLKLLGRSAFEKPVEPKDGKLCNVLLDALVYVVRLHAVVEEATKEIPVLLFAVHFAFGGRVIELQLLHRVSDGGNFLSQKVFEIVALVALSFSLRDTSSNPRIFCPAGD